MGRLWTRMLKEMQNKEWIKPNLVSLYIVRSQPAQRSSLGCGRIRGGTCHLRKPNAPVIGEGLLNMIYLLLHGMAAAVDREREYGTRAPVIPAKG